MLSSSPGFVRTSRGVTSASNFQFHNCHKPFFFIGIVLICSLTGFGSALNIETLVAAAEKRETPIEVLFSPYNIYSSCEIG